MYIPRTPALERAAHDLGHGQAGLGIERAAPCGLELLVRRRVLHALVVREHHRDQPRIRRALHVVLPAQRMQARARPAHLTGDRAQRDQAARVVGARRVLRDPHAPEDDRGAGLAPQLRDRADQLGVDPADLRGALGRVLLHGLRELAVVRHAIADELAVDQPEPDDLVQHAVVERDVGARLDLAEHVGVVGDPLAPHVDDDQLRAAPPRLLEERRRDGVVRRRVRARQDRHVGVDDVAVRRRHGPGADALEQRGDARGVAQARAVVDVVGPEPGADQLLEEVGLLVRALRRAEPGDRPRSVLAVDPLQPGRHEVERLLPRRLAEVRQHLVVVDEPARLAAPPARPAHVARERALGVGPFAPDQRHRQPLLRRGVVPAVAALHAQPALVARLLAAVRERDRPALVVHVIRQRAAHAAIRAHRVDRPELLARADRHVADRLVDQRARGAGGHALAAGHARRLAHRIVEVERDPRLIALAAAADHVVALDVVAGPHAAVAQDARIVVDADHRVRVILAAPPPVGQVVAADAVPASQHEQLVVGRRRLLRILVGRGLVDEQEPREHRPLPLDLVGGGLDLHPVLARAHAGGGQHPPAHVDRARPADADGVVALVVAQGGDLDPHGLRRLPDRRAVGDADLVAVDGQRHRPGLDGFRAGDRHVRSVPPTRVGYPASARVRSAASP